MFLRIGLLPGRANVFCVQHNYSHEKCKPFSSLARLQAFNVNVNHRAYVKQHVVRHAKCEGSCMKVLDSFYVYSVECSKHMTRAIEVSSLNKVLLTRHISWARFLKTLLENTVLSTFLGHQLNPASIAPTSHWYDYSNGDSRQNSKTLHLPRFRKQNAHLLASKSCACNSKTCLQRNVSKACLSHKTSQQTQTLYIYRIPQHSVKSPQDQANTGPTAAKHPPGLHPSITDFTGLQVQTLDRCVRAEDGGHCLRK